MKKNFMLIGLVLVLAVVYVVFFTDWFRSGAIHISHTSRPVAVARNGPAALRLAFSLGDFYELTEIKVVPLAEWQTNKNAQPVWHLVSDDGSDSVDHFFYGENIGGMDPAVEGTQAKPLQPGITYRMFISAGRTKGWHDFQVNAVVGE